MSAVTVSAPLSTMQLIDHSSCVTRVTVADCLVRGELCQYGMRHMHTLQPACHQQLVAQCEWYNPPVKVPRTLLPRRHAANSEHFVLSKLFTSSPGMLFLSPPTPCACAAEQAPSPNMMQPQHRLSAS